VIFVIRVTYDHACSIVCIHRNALTDLTIKQPNSSGFHMSVFQQNQYEKSFTLMSVSQYNNDLHFAGRNSCLLRIWASLCSLTWFDECKTI